jgi:hypothetical protein
MGARQESNFGAYMICRHTVFGRYVSPIFRFVKFHELPLKVDFEFAFLVTMRCLPIGVLESFAKAHKNLWTD